MHPALDAALAELVPGEKQTDLLRACLHAGESQAASWRRFQGSGPSFLELLKADRPDLKRIAPLLFQALRTEPGMLDATLSTVLRSSYLREQLRSQEVDRICQLVLSTLEGSGVRFILLRGVAYGATLYPEPALRHSHDLNLLVEESELAAAGEALYRTGRFVAPPAPAGSDALLLFHRSSLPVLLHRRLFRLSHYRLDWRELSARSEVAGVVGRPARLLAPADALLHTCYQLLHRPRLSPLVWACDGYRIVSERGDLDWDALLATAERSRATLPAYVALGYLKHRLDAPVPAEILRSLASAADRTAPIDRDVALLALRARGRPAMRGLLHRPLGWRDRVAALRWLLFPSPEYLRWAYGVSRPELLPLYYVGRGARYLSREAMQRFARPAPAAGAD
jgi:hypothetical protein